MPPGDRPVTRPAGAVTRPGASITRLAGPPLSPTSDWRALSRRDGGRCRRQRPARLHGVQRQPRRPCAGRHVHCYADQRGASKPEPGQQDETGQPRAEGRTQRVQRIQGARLGPRVLGPAGEPPHGQGKRRPHRRGRRQQHRQAREKADQAEPGAPVAVGVRGGEYRLESGERRGDEQRARRDRAFEQGIKAQGPSAREPEREPAAQRRAPGQPPHERRQHGPRGGDRVPHVQHEQARPDHLVDEGRRTRQEVDEEKEAARSGMSHEPLDFDRRSSPGRPPPNGTLSQAPVQRKEQDRVPAVPPRRGCRAPVTTALVQS